MPLYQTIRRLAGRRFGRFAVGLALAAIFVAQMVGSGFHRHDLTKEDTDCVSCYLSAHVPSSTPNVDIGPAAPLAYLSYVIEAVCIYASFISRSYLVPHSQAPPVSSSDSV